MEDGSTKKRARAAPKQFEEMDKKAEKTALQLAWYDDAATLDSVSFDDAALLATYDPSDKGSGAVFGDPDGLYVGAASYYNTGSTAITTPSTIVSMPRAERHSSSKRGS